MYFYCFNRAIFHKFTIFSLTKALKCAKIKVEGAKLFEIPSTHPRGRAIWLAVVILLCSSPPGDWLKPEAEPYPKEGLVDFMVEVLEALGLVKRVEPTKTSVQTTVPAPVAVSRREAGQPFWVKAAEIRRHNPRGNNPKPFNRVRVPSYFVEPVIVLVNRKGCFAIDKFDRRELLRKEDRS